MSQGNVKKNLSWNTIGMILYNLAVWVFGFLIIRMLGEVHSGYYAIASSVGNTIYAVSLWGMRSYIVSDTESRYTEDEYLTSRIISILISCVVLVLTALIGGYGAEVTHVLYAYTLFKMSEALIEVLDCFGQKRLIMDINAKSMVLRGLLYMVFFWLTLRFTADMTAGFAAMAGISLLVFFFYNLRKMRSVAEIHGLSANLAHLKEILVRCFPIMAFEVLSSSVVAVPRLFFGRSGSMADLGVYNSIYTMVIFLQLTVNILIYTLSPYLARSYQSHDKASYRKYLLLLVGGACFLAGGAELLVLLIGKPVMSLLFGSGPGQMYHYLYLGILSGLSLTFTWIITQIFVIRGYLYAHLICALISAGSCFLFSAWLIRPENCNTISIVLICTNLVFLCAAGILLRRKPAGTVQN